jgi:uncharacterized membrane protein YdjX (TVP38/TMEM64 family)
MTNKRRTNRKRHNHRRAHKYTNLILTGFSIVVAFLLSQVSSFHWFFLHLGSLGYLGAFLAGILFVSTFTMVSGALILLLLAETISPVAIGLIAGLGAVVGDLIIFHIVKDTLSTEIRDLYHRFGGKHLTHLLHTKYFRWSLPVIGAIIIASPLPDELGITLMGISKMNTIKFVLVSYILNSIGIFIVVWASTIIKP